MDERQLIYLAAVKKTGNLRQAARMLEREQSTITRSLKNLENELGISIFRRGTRGLSVTREGEVFFDFAEKALAVLEIKGLLMEAVNEHNRAEQKEGC